MKFSLSNLLAIVSILVWATAWATTEKKAASPETAKYLAFESDGQMLNTKWKSADHKKSD